MAINKYQGHTFLKIGIHVLIDAFDHGQLYVAMSQVWAKSAPNKMFC